MINKFIFPLKVYIEDTDYAGVVYHSNYLNYFERARSEWAEELGCGIRWQREQGIYFPVRAIKIDFLKPAKLGDHLEVVTQLIELKQTNLTYGQHLRLSQSPDTILCRADVKIVCVGQSFRPQALPRCILHEIIVEEG